MNTQATLQRLEAGQALPLPRRSGRPAVLTEGELLVQEPATWLAGTLVVPAPRRIVAPALLPSLDGCSVVAVHASAVLVHQVQPWLSRTRLRAFAGRLRHALGRSHAAAA